MFARALAVAALATTLVTGAARATDRAAVNCALGKMTAALRESSALNACFRRALASGSDIDQTCLRAALTKAQTAFDKIEARGGCTVTGDVGGVSRLVDDCTTRIVAAVSINACQPAGASCGSVLTQCCPGLTCAVVLGQDPVCE